ncbi:MAG: 30S ribosome-binding factor RbfA [Candidatus Paracaedibacteraceae bacterium]|nr:30S ribosome-binding factor RbfA [Candidatus Paracaedibacteraceae bacterium]
MSRLELFVPTKASSHRQKKVSEEIKHHLAHALSRGDLPPIRNTKSKNGGFLTFPTPITVTKIEVSPDLKHATTYIMPLGGNQQEEALYFVRAHKGYLRKFLGSKIQLRHTPDLHFALDNSFDNADRIRQILEDVIPKEILVKEEPEESSE